MPSTVTNLSFIEKAQVGINSVQGWTDDVRPFSKGFSASTLYGNGVAVPVFTSGTPSTSLGFTDTSVSVAFTNVLINAASVQYAPIPAYQYQQIEQYADTYLPGLISRTLQNITDAGYAAFNTTNFPTASNKAISAGWLEATPTLAALEIAVQAAIKSKNLDKNKIMVLMPSGTYAAFKAVLNALNRDIITGLGYTVIPVYASGFNATAITDGSAVGIAIGQDVATPNTPEEFQFLVDDNSKFGIGFHVMGDMINRNVGIGLSAVYGVSKLNATGFKWITVS